MKFKEKFSKNETSNSRDWKEKNKSYLNQLQKFLDATDRIKEEELRNHIIAQMLKCDLILTQIAEREIEKSKENKV
ncbi:MAG: hypothetical protein ACI4UU_01295 [Clostridia bacterium]